MSLNFLALILQNIKHKKFIKIFYFEEANDSLLRRSNHGVIGYVLLRNVKFQASKLTFNLTENKLISFKDKY